MTRKRVEHQQGTFGRSFALSNNQLDKCPGSRLADVSDNAVAIYSLLYWQRVSFISFVRDAGEHFGTRRKHDIRKIEKSYIAISTNPEKRAEERGKRVRTLRKKFTIYIYSLWGVYTCVLYLEGGE
jgi:hypothetical protein